MTLPVLANTASTREVIFYRIALFTPGVLHVALVAFSEQLRGIALMSIFYGGLPYVIFLIGALYWSRDKSAQQFRKWLLKAPLWYLATFSVIFIILALSGGEPSGIIAEFPSTGLMLVLMAAGVLAYSYVWVVLVLGGWKLLNRSRGPLASSPAR
jgi:hypothetical protein